MGVKKEAWLIKTTGEADRGQNRFVDHVWNLVDYQTWERWEAQPLLWANSNFTPELCALHNRLGLKYFKGQVIEQIDVISVDVFCVGIALLVCGCQSAFCFSSTIFFHIFLITGQVSITLGRHQAIRQYHCSVPLFEYASLWDCPSMCCQVVKHSPFKDVLTLYISCL